MVGLVDAGDPQAQPPVLPALVERYDYDPYGKTYIESGDGLERRAASKYGNPYAWTGQRYDPGVGLYHFPFRSYSPELGRWQQRDPLGYVDGPNLYEYARSSPVVLVDPLGLYPPGDDNDFGDQKDTLTLPGGRVVRHYYRKKLFGGMEYVRTVVLEPDSIGTAGAIGDIHDGKEASLASVNRAATVGKVVLQCAAVAIAISVPDPSDIALLVADKLGMKYIGGVLYKKVLGKWVRASAEDAATLAHKIDDAAAHIDKLKEAQKDLADLYEKLSKTHRAKERKQLLEDIEKLEKSIKGHIKEVDEKFGIDLSPCE